MPTTLTGRYQPQTLAEDPFSAVGQAEPALLRDKIINHVVVALDASPSMGGHVPAVRAQLRTLIEDLAEKSKVMDQETRVTIYAFSTTVQVLAFDVDVLRLPPVWETYALRHEMTALVDATVIAVDDLGTTSTVYGDHGFLFYLITDGQENDSQRQPEAASTRLARLPENWTMAALVPDPRGRRYAVDYLGFPADNVAMWDTSSREGFAAAATTIRTATAGYMTGRASGQRGTRTLFSTGADAVNDQTVSAAVQTGALTPLPRGSYTLLDVTAREMTRPFVERHGHPYQNGRLYYQLTKTENIQPQKQIVVVDKQTGDAYADETSEIVGGQQVGSPNLRRMIGLPEVHVKVRPNFNPRYAVFVQSTAPNRNLIPGQQAFLLQT